MPQNMPKDERTLFREIAGLVKRVAALETATRAGHTSISSGSLVVRDTDTGAVLASVSSGDNTDDDGNAIPAGLSAAVGDVDGAVLRDGSVDASKVSFSISAGGITSTVGPVAPTDPPPAVGDLWVDTSHGNLVNRWDGATWAALPVGADAIQAGAITANLIAANAITAGQIAAGAIDGKVITGATIQTIASDGGFFAYSGAPTLGNLIVSIASAAGTDDFGNAYPQGLDVNQGAISGSQITIEPGAGNGVFVYGTAPTTTTFNTGSGTWTAPAGVTSVKVEAWGGGGSGGGYDTVDAVGGGGGGGGEYAAEATFAVTPGNGYAYAVGAGGTAVSGGANGRTGSDTTFGGTITAHGGTGGTPSAAGIGGSGSTNTAHFSGGVGSLSFSAFGGGGASSGGFSSAGNSAATDTQAGAAAVTGGGGGGAGGTSTKAGTAGMSPGGGGGGAGSQGTSGAGANGRVTITFTPPRTLLASIAGAAGTDDYGNAYPQGISGSKLTVDGVDVTSAWQSYTPTWTSSGTNPTLGNGSITGRYMRIGKTVHATIRLVLGSTSSPGTATYLFSLPFTSANDTVNYLGTARFTAASLWIGQVTLGANSNLVNATFPSSSTATTGANMSATTTPWSSPPTGNTLLMSITYQIA